MILLKEQQSSLFLTFLFKLSSTLFFKLFQAVFTLNLGLFFKLFLAFPELCDPGFFKAFEEPLLLIPCSLFRSAHFELMLFLDLLSFNGINLSLSVRCLLLHFPKSLDLTLPLLPLTSLLSEMFSLLGVTSLLELNDFLLKGLFFTTCFFLGCDGRSIADSSLFLESLYFLFLV